MKNLKCLRRSLIIGCILTLLSGQTAFAEIGGNDKDYSYTVTLSSGNQGTFTDAGGVQVTGSGYQIVQENDSTIRIFGLKYGDMVMLNAQAGINMEENEKYYIRGVRESGRDNNTVGNSAFMVESDRDYVVAYGVKGNMVAYTVNYQDQSGNALAESETFYGAAGDRPVVAFRYVENYQPQAYNLTKTLGENEAENVFTFVYQPSVQSMTATTDTTETTDTTTAIGAGETQTAETAGTAAAGTDTEGSNTGADVAEGTGAAEEAGIADMAPGESGEATEDTQTTEDEQVPQELVNLDDEETPLSDMEDVVKSKGRSPGSMVLAGVIAVVALAGLSALGVIYLKKKRKQND